MQLNVQDLRWFRDGEQADASIRADQFSFLSFEVNANISVKTFLN